MWVCRDGFDYVVRKQEKQKICFGSGKARDTSSRNGMSSFMKYHTPENFPNIGPGKYNVMESFKASLSKPCSKSFSRRGYGGIARFGLSITHTEDYPAPVDYNIISFPAKVDELKHPFGSTAKRKTFQINKNPGPGVYRDVMLIKKRIIFDHSFGGHMKMRLAVEMKCCKRNTDICEICDEKPEGDYWHLNNRVFLCRPCMIQERRRPLKHLKKDLKNFRRIRDCSMIHSHEGTDANLWLMHPGVIEKWAQREAYLCSYIKD